MAGKTLVIYKQTLTYDNGTQQSINTQTTTPIQPKKIIPVQTKTQTTNTVTTTKTNKYKVANGDNLWLIARKFGTTVDKIKKLNNMKSDALKIGMVLIIK